MQPIRIGTRGSKLAMWQAEWVASALRGSGLDAKIVQIATLGDTRSESIGKLSSVGVFTKSIQTALLNGEVDVAVHSLKDLPTDPVDGLRLAAVPKRESNCDVLVCREAASLRDLPPDTKVGTGSTRRRAQVLFARPDVRVLDIRGNVDTRLARLDSGDFDAILLAEAGLRRLGLHERISTVLPATDFLPAVGQGALGIETRSGSDDIASAMARLDDTESRVSVTAERSLLRALRGGCLAPIGAWGRIESNLLRLDAAVFSPDGARRLHAYTEGNADDAENVGEIVADQLKQARCWRVVGRCPLREHQPAKSDDTTFRHMRCKCVSATVGKSPDGIVRVWF